MVFGVLWLTMAIKNVVHSSQPLSFAAQLRQVQDVKDIQSDERFWYAVGPSSQMERFDTYMVRRYALNETAAWGFIDPGWTLPVYFLGAFHRGDPKIASNGWMIDDEDEDDDVGVPFQDTQLYK